MSNEQGECLYERKGRSGKEEAMRAVVEAGGKEKTGWRRGERKKAVGEGGRS